LSEAASRPQSERPKLTPKYDDGDSISTGSGGGISNVTTPSPPPVTPTQDNSNKYKALYDFEPGKYYQ